MIPCRAAALLGGVDLLIIDEFGFEKLERMDCPLAANLLYKVIEVRYPRRTRAW